MWISSTEFEDVKSSVCLRPQRFHCNAVKMSECLSWTGLHSSSPLNFLKKEDAPPKMSLVSISSLIFQRRRTSRHLWWSPLWNEAASCAIVTVAFCPQCQTLTVLRSVSILGQSFTSACWAILVFICKCVLFFIFLTELWNQGSS